MRLLYGRYEFSQYLDYLEKPYLVLNFSGMAENILQLNLLPPNQFNEMDDPEFIMWYTDWILNNQDAFIRFITMIEELTRGTVVYIVMGDETFTDGIDESFIKLIKLRYGVNAYYVNDKRDLVEMNFGFIEETDFDPYYGIRNYDVDITRYNAIKETIRIQNGGRPNYD